jgi:hopene-associated glycosyltransferase HpnB
MEALAAVLSALSAVLWVGLALSPWGVWRNREVLDAANAAKDCVSLEEITALIPARNEAEVIVQTLRSLVDQGAGLKIVVVDDGSEDGTAEIARQASADIRVVRGAALPRGWSGKLWALEQGRRQVTTPYTLLLDADIRLESGVLAALRENMRRENLSFLSLMAAPSMALAWEKLLMPAFVYFFKIMYPFAAVNSERTQTAAAAGGCILVESRVLERIGGFTSIKGAVIDDCALAARVKSHGFKIWLGLTHSVKSIRGYRRLKEIRDMVARSAFSQLRYSFGRLILCTLALLLIYLIPAASLASSSNTVRVLSAASLAIMFVTYLPILRFYRRSWAWALCLPFIAALFLAMTWLSAMRYWRGEQTRWKGRIYRRRRTGNDVSDIESKG